MLYDLAVVIEAEDVHTSPVRVAWPLLVAVQYDVVPLSDHPFEMESIEIRDMLATVFSYRIGVHNPFVPRSKSTMRAVAQANYK